MPVVMSMHLRDTTLVEQRAKVLFGSAASGAVKVVRAVPSAPPSAMLTPHRAGLHRHSTGFDDAIAVRALLEVLCGPWELEVVLSDVDPRGELEKS